MGLLLSQFFKSCQQLAPPLLRTLRAVVDTELRKEGADGLGVGAVLRLLDLLAERRVRDFLRAGIFFRSGCRDRLLRGLGRGFFRLAGSFFRMTSSISS
jgi:hypothetical protein